VSIPSPPAVVVPPTTTPTVPATVPPTVFWPTQVVDPNMALKLQELSAQIAAISQQLNNGSGALSTVQPASIERFYTLWSHYGQNRLLLIMQRLFIPGSVQR
jgi:hypothetical protein